MAFSPMQAPCHLRNDGGEETDKGVEDAKNLAAFKTGST